MIILGDTNWDLSSLVPNEHNDLASNAAKLSAFYDLFGLL